MNFEVELGTEHWEKFYQYIRKKVKKSLSIKNKFWLNLVIWLFLTLTLVLFINFLSEFHWPTALFVFSLGVIFYLYLLWFNKKLIGAYKPLDNGTFCGKRYYVIDKDGLSEKANGFHTHYEWSVFKSVEVGNNLLLLFTDNTIALLFPIEQLDDSEGLIAKLKTLIA